MLIYHPVFDVYHCIFRMLQLIVKMQSGEVEVEKIRIWDYYLTFPHEIVKISFPREYLEYKKFFKEINNPYENILGTKRTFDKMQSIQMTALKSLASYNFIDTKKLDKGLVSRLDFELSSELFTQINDLSPREKNIIELLTKVFYDIPLLGENGLKYRTGLLNFKYDNV
jgi:hypothetical protein